MLNPDRIRAKLQDISSALERLDRFRTMSREAFLADEDAQDIARSRLLTAMEAAADFPGKVGNEKANALLTGMVRQLSAGDRTGFAYWLVISKKIKA